jgi:hypothetical protein
LIVDRDRMIAEMLERVGARVDRDDPAFVLVELNRLALEETVNALAARVQSIVSQLETAGRTAGASVGRAAAAQAADAFGNAVQNIREEGRRVLAETRETLLREAATRKRAAMAPRWSAFVLVTVIAASGGLGLGLAAGSRIDAATHAGVMDRSCGNWRPV